MKNFNFKVFFKKVLILQGIAAGELFLHQAKIYHRDLKPQNILVKKKLEYITLFNFFFQLDENLNPKICDFGIAHIVQTLAKTTKSEASTPHYAAPEFLIANQVSDRIDCYSFGICM